MSPAGRNKRLNFAEGKHYPAPLASHDDVVSDPTAFWDTLRRFHFLMTTKFMIPVIGGKELDLHTLYVEVTKRGGYEKVVAEKKWREVGNVFRFSPTTTSASFVLRKHYFGLLYQYEQVYFFKLQGPVFTPTASFSAGGSPSWRPELALVEYSPKTTTDSPEPPVEAMGTIEGKFDCGYLVSVKLGAEILRGVLYHPEQPDSSTRVPKSYSAIVPYTPKPCVSNRRRRRRNRRRGDPNYPKPNRSGYNFFFAEKHYKLKSLYPNREREFTKMIGLPEHWLERQRKVQERIERVQRENEVQANRGAWKLRGPTRVTKNRGSQRNQKKFLRPLALLLESNACNGPLISKGLFPSQKISTFRCCLRLYFRLSAACVLM